MDLYADPMGTLKSLEAPVRSGPLECHCGGTEIGSAAGRMGYRQLLVAIARRKKVRLAGRSARRRMK